MNGFEKRSKVKMGKILGTASRILNEEGVSELNIRRIARESNVSQASIYKYFGNKEALTKSVIEHIVEQSHRAQAAIIHGEGSFQMKITALVNRKMKNISNMHIELLQSMVENQPDIAEIFTPLLNEKIFPLYRELFTQGREEGIIETSLSDTSLHIYLDMFIDGLRKHVDVLSEDKDQVSISREFTQLFLYGLMGQGSS